MVYRTLRWLGDRLKDLFYDSTNQHLDNGRIVAALSMASLVGAMIWNMHLGKEINLAELGSCEAAILGALYIYIYHDRKQNAG